MCLKFKGICPAGTMGQYCQTIVNQCPSYCQNGAICTFLGINSYRCDCLPGFTGTNCETRANICSSVTCFNNGI